jgi:hypothetical protein
MVRPSKNSLDEQAQQLGRSTTMSIRSIPRWLRILCEVLSEGTPVVVTDLKVRIIELLDARVLGRIARSLMNRKSS